MRELSNELAALLLETQNSDGGWGAVGERPSNTEATALVLDALRSLEGPAARQAAARGVAWLAAHQRDDGSWPFAGELDEASWATSLAVLSLARLDRLPDRALRAARWLLAQEGRPFNWWQRLVFLWLPEERRVRLNPDLKGWPWHEQSFSWVEPTAFALLALKRLRRRLDPARADERIRQGELLLYDRMCRGGGWNYGNSTVLGEDLWPYPDVTAVALIALQDRAAEEANQRSLAALEGMLDESASGLALSWSILCLRLYGRTAGRWREQLARRHVLSGFLGETRTRALALLALESRADGFRV